MSQSNRVTIAALDISKVYHPKRHLTPVKQEEDVQALSPITFLARTGESIGIIGRNGSGKSTFLNILAGNERPTTGRVLVSSQPALLGVSAALQPDLSGRDNARLGLLAMGVSPKKVPSLVPDTLEWAGLTEAADRPMKTYSSGMQARLKFSITTTTHQNILLVDEALSTGDATFAKKAERRMKSFLKNAGTVIIVSHAPGIIEKHTRRAIWIHDGNIIADDKTPRVVKYYKAWTRYENLGNSRAAANIISRLQEDFHPIKAMLDSDAARFLDSGFDGSQMRQLSNRH